MCWQEKEHVQKKIHSATLHVIRKGKGRFPDILGKKDLLLTPHEHTTDCAQQRVFFASVI